MRRHTPTLSLPRWLTRAALGLATAAMLSTTFAAPAAADDVPIGELRIAVQDLSTKEELGFVSPGQTLRLKVGDRVRLRMVAIPTAANRAPRYPSTAFSLLAGKARVSLSNVKAQEGSAILQGVRADDPNNRRSTTLVEYRLLESVNIRKGLRTGTITVVVSDPRARQDEGVRGRGERTWNDRYDRDDRYNTDDRYDRDDRYNTDDRYGRDDRGNRRGVTLYEHQDFRGDSEFFAYDDERLNDNRIRQDRASSIRVDRGCRVELFEHADYKGKVTVLAIDESDLRRTRVGSDTVSSLRIDCRGQDGGGGQPGNDPYDNRAGVVLYEHQNFQGTAEFFAYDDERLNDNRIRQDRASSVRVARGCVVELYEHPNYEGRRTTLDRDVTDLRGSGVGNDSVSSLRVRCRGGGQPGNDPYDDRAGVVLYEHQNFQGTAEFFAYDDERLNDNRIRQDRASSVRVARGCVVELYEHPNYEGRRTTLDRDVTDLRGSGVGNDSVSSLRVRCRGGSNQPGGDPFGGRAGVVLYEHQNFQGTAEFFAYDDERLNDNRIRQDRASSLRVHPGCIVELYEHPNYEGRRTTFDRDVTNLRGSGVGNDSASSLRVRCQRY